MLPEPGMFALLLLLGGWIAVDGTSCGQFMISRPFVAATLAGWVVGNPLAGGAVGVLLEAFHLTVLPVGAARYPEGGPAAVAAGAVFASAAPTSAALLTTVIFFLVWEWLSGESVRLLRQLNIRLFAHARSLPYPPRHLERQHLAALALDFVRGTLIVAAGITFLAALLQISRLAWGLGDRIPQLVLAAGLSALLAGSLRLFGGRGRFFAAGAVFGLLVHLARQ